MNLWLYVIHFSLCCWRFISEKPLKPGEVGKVSTKQLPLYLIYPSNIIHTIFITNRYVYPSVVIMKWHIVFSISIFSFDFIRKMATKAKGHLRKKMVDLSSGP